MSAYQNRNFTLSLIHQIHAISPCQNKLPCSFQIQIKLVLEFSIYMTQIHTCALSAYCDNEECNQ